MTDPSDPSSTQGLPPPGAPPDGVPGWTAPGTPTPGWRPPPDAPPTKKSRRGRNIVVAIIAVVAVAGGARLYAAYQQQQNYNTGHTAYLVGDCGNAIGPLSKAASGDPGSKDSDVVPKAEAELEECEALMAVDDLAASGDAGGAVLGYRAFIGEYPDSLLIDTAMSSAQALLADSPETAATIDVCDEIDGLAEGGFIASPEDSLPPLLYACGQTYEAGNDLAAALASYLRFRTEYPDHELADAVDVAYARAAVAEADQVGAPELPPPVEAGTAGGTAGQATIVIQNDSPDSLAMVFSGPDVRVEDLERCPGCQKYPAPGPSECPGLGPVAEYVVAPGSYDVVVKSGTGAAVTPFRGTWELEAGRVYESCFYIVTRQ